MSTFAVGEVAIITASQCAKFPVGMEVTILSINPNCSLGEYVIADEGVCCYVAHGWQLRKRRPPQDWHKLAKLDQVPSDCVAEREVCV